MLLTDAELAAIRQHAEREYPAECCGVVLVKAGDAADRLVRACRNIQDELHAKDPRRFPRTARTGYYIAPEDLLEIDRRQQEEYALEVIYHSHVDAGPYFSETDQRNALVNGEPAYPETTYVVVEVREGVPKEARAFQWVPARRDFVEVPLAIGVQNR